MRHVQPLLLALALAAPSSGQESWRGTFEKVAHLLPPDSEVVTVARRFPPERSRLPAVIRQDGSIAREPLTELPMAPPGREPLVFEKDLDGDAVDEIAVVSRSRDGERTYIRVDIFARGDSGDFRSILSVYDSLHSRFEGREDRIYADVSDRDTLVLRLILSKMPADVVLEDTGPYKILKARVHGSHIPAASRWPAEIDGADDLEYGTCACRMRALHLAETIHAQGNSKLAIAICERALGANNDYYAYACLGDIMMDLGKEDEAREYYTKAATLWPPGTVSNLTAEYYENRGLHGDAGRYRDRAAAELAACYSRWLAVHVVVLVVSLAILFVCGWVVVTRSFRLRARALLAVAAAGLMAIYLHVLFPQRGCEDADREAAQDGRERPKPPA
jgi:hypothetical protein